MAFVVGVSDYTFFPDLRTPVHDARAVRETLEQISSKFHVVVPANTTRDGILDSFDAFAETIQENDSVLVFFSGHGFEREGINYLVPSEFPGFRDEQLGHDAITLDYLMNTLEERGAGRVMLILDACRTDVLPSPVQSTEAGPSSTTAAASSQAFPASVISTSSPLREDRTTDAEVVARPAGFVEVGAPRRTLIAYSASPRRPAYSRREREPADIPSFFTRNFTHFFGDLQDAPIHDVFEEISAEVWRVSGREQRPWVNTSTFPSRYVLNPTQGYHDEGAKLWNRAALAGEDTLHGALCAFAKQYPESEHLPAARGRILQLEATFPEDARRCNSI